MPMEPEAGEKESDFMGRCITHFRDKGSEQDQAVAACMNIWGGKVKEKSVREAVAPKDLEPKEVFMARGMELAKSKGIEEEAAKRLCEAIWADALEAAKSRRPEDQPDPAEEERMKGVDAAIKGCGDKPKKPMM